MHGGINGACLLKTGSVQAEETWTGSLSQTSDDQMQWMKKMLWLLMFFSGVHADIVVEEDRSG